MLPTLQTIRRRRAALSERFRGMDITALEESCVPSYCHPNVLAAGVAWWRLLGVRALLERERVRGPLLDFGAGTGEIAQFLDGSTDYHFIESDERLAEALLNWHPRARREQLERLPNGYFKAVVALDSLEHNEDLNEILSHLAGALSDDGVFVLSGPTETWLYKLGRKIAGFGGHYHKHTVYDVERAVASRFTSVRVARVPPLAALFRVSVWRKRLAS